MQLLLEHLSAFPYIWIPWLWCSQAIFVQVRCAADGEDTRTPSIVAVIGLHSVSKLRPRERMSGTSCCRTPRGGWRRRRSCEEKRNYQMHFHTPALISIERTSNLQPAQLLQNGGESKDREREAEAEHRNNYLKIRFYARQRHKPTQKQQDSRYCEDQPHSASRSYFVAVVDRDHITTAALRKVGKSLAMRWAIFYHEMAVGALRTPGNYGTIE